METDPRQVFMDISNRLAEGEALADIQKVCEDERSEDCRDHRQRFIRDSERLAAGESIETVAKESRAHTFRQVRADAARFATDGKLNLSTLTVLDDEKEDQDPRKELLKRLAAMGD